MCDSSGVLNYLYGHSVGLNVDIIINSRGRGGFNSFLYNAAGEQSISLIKYI